MKSIFVLIVTLVNLSAFGGSKPEWVQNTPKDDAKVLFFVGRSTKVESEADGVRMASKDAREQLLRQEFGTTIKIDSVQTETLTDTTLDSKLVEASELVVLKGFKILNTYYEKQDERYVVWALFSVPLTEIRLEKKRLLELQRKQFLAETEKLKDEIVSREGTFDNGAKPKIHKGMKKSEVIAAFGTPKKAEKDDYFGSRFMYNDDKSDFCESIVCFVNFNNRGRVSSWTNIKPDYTTDLDDEVKVKFVSPISPQKFFSKYGYAVENVNRYLVSCGCKLSVGKILEPMSDRCKKGFEQMYEHLREQAR